MHTYIIHTYKLKNYTYELMVGGGRTSTPHLVEWQGKALCIYQQNPMHKIIENFTIFLLLGMSAENMWKK